jgi:polysaccharide biosynthesis/export protein
VKFKTHLYCLVVCFLYAACVSPKKFAYFTDVHPDSLLVKLPPINYAPVLLQPDDVIEIKISGKNDATANDFSAKSAGYGNGQLVIPSYLIDKDGQIEMYKLGRLTVTGLTTLQLKDTLVHKLKEYLIEPIVNVRLVNFRYTILGDVAKPGTYSTTNERTTVFEALGYAGDMTFLSKRNNVKLLRDSMGVRTLATLDFSNSSVLNSPYYYIRKNDVLYVDTKAKMRQTETAFSRVAILIGVLSSLVALTVFFRN